MAYTFTKSSIKPEQILLLKAALFPPAEALVYWKLWKKCRQLDHFTSASEKLLPAIFDTLDHESQRLMPLVYRNLEKTSDPLIPSLRGIYRHTWLKNQRFLQKVQQIVGALQAAGVDTIALKGIPLSLLYYGDMGVRLMSDLDVLVPTSQADAAIQVLQQKPLQFKRSDFDYRYRRIIHAMHMQDSNNIDMDLHWNLIVQHVYADADKPFWAARQPLTLANGLQTHVLSPTHQVFHNLVHGFGWAGKPAIRWLADSYVIYTKPDITIDWHGLLDLAEHYQLVVPIQQGLRVLQSDFRLELPADVCERLHQLTIGTAEAAYFALLEKKPTNVFGKIIRQVQLPRVEYQSFQKERSGLTMSRWVLLRLERTLRMMSRWGYEIAQAKLKKSGLILSR